MEKKLLAAVVVIFLVSLYWILPAQRRADEAYIRQWATDNTHTIVSIERCYWTLGPYWFNKNTRIYKTDLDNGKTYWFRFRLFKTDIKEYP